MQVFFNPMFTRLYMHGMYRAYDEISTPTHTLQIKYMFIIYLYPYLYLVWKLFVTLIP
jgi:hypothetical protein